MERAYNAFAAKIATDKDGTQRVMPFDEASEGEPCIEMRIRICPGGAMSNLLMRLIKVHARVVYGMPFLCCYSRRDSEPPPHLADRGAEVGMCRKALFVN